MKNLFRDLGIAIPPNLRDLDTQPTTLLLLTPVSAADIRYDAAGNRWQVTVSQHNLGRVPLEPVTYKWGYPQIVDTSRLRGFVLG